MKASQRVFINTIAQYVRTAINMCLSLYTVRLVLLTLGQSDFGIYSLIAGLVAMLSFLTNSLVNTTQRFVSFYQGKGITEKVREVFNNSLVLHICIGVIVASILEVLTPFLFDGFLNIPETRIDAAKVVFQVVVVILFTTFVTAPFRALLISHENIVYISIIDVMDGVLKVIFVTLMTMVSYDKLVFYALLMLGIQLFNFLALSVYCYRKYEECCIPNPKRVTIKYFKELSSYAGWNVYMTGCIVGRQQGIAIILNRLMGPIVNAAYGIGFQIAGYTNFLSVSIVNAISPQIIKAEGSGDRQRALWLSNVACKFIFLLLAIVCVPCIFEIDSILKWWLKDVPENANLFCIMVMCSLLCDSFSLGLAYINQAIGKIGAYSFTINTPKLVTLPAAIVMLKYGCDLFEIASMYVSIEMFCAVLRIYFIKRTAGLNVNLFIKDVVFKGIPPFAICILSSWICVNFMQFPYRFIITFIISSIIYLLTFYLFGLTAKEHNIVNNIITSTTSKIK